MNMGMASVVFVRCWESDAISSASGKVVGFAKMNYQI